MFTAWRRKLRLWFCVALLGAGLSEGALFLITQAYASEHVPSWGFSPWWVVVLRSAIPVLLYDFVRRVIACSERQKREADIADLRERLSKARRQYSVEI